MPGRFVRAVAVRGSLGVFRRSAGSTPLRPQLGARARFRSGAPPSRWRDLSAGARRRLGAHLRLERTRGRVTVTRPRSAGRVGSRRACTRRAARQHAEPRPRVLRGWRPPCDSPVGGGLRPPDRHHPGPARTARRHPRDPRFAHSHPRAVRPARARGDVRSTDTDSRGGRFSPRSALAAVAIAAGALGAALALIGFALAAAVGGAVAVAAGISAAVSSGFAPYSALPSTAMALSLWASGLTVGTIWALEWRSGASLRNTARFAIAFSACAALLKLLMLLHPNMPVGDTLFQAHRYRTVVEGNLYFTSIAPGNYQFPYAPGLYVAAAPFAAMVSREAGDMTLLRIFVAVTDGVAGAFLYLMIVRSWGDRLAAAVSVALYHLIPLGFGVARTGNLTNAFAQSLAVVALVMISNPSLRSERRLLVAGLAALLSAAFMSHTSTFAIAVSRMPAGHCGVSLERRAGPPLPRHSGRHCGRCRGGCGYRALLRSLRRHLSCRVHAAHR